MGIVEAVNEAVMWTAEAENSRVVALAELAKCLAAEMVSEGPSKVPPPRAAIAKELRATLEDLEALRDGDDAEASLGVVLSTPVWDTTRPEPPKPRAARRKGRGGAEEAVDAVAVPRRGRGDGGAA